MPSINDIDRTRTFSSTVESAWRSSHEAVVFCYLADSDGTYLRDLTPTGGSVTADARRGVRRTASLTFVDTDGTLLPTNSLAYPLGPFGGNLIVVCRGILSGGVSSLVPLGTFTPRSVSINTGSDGTTVQVEAEDLSALLSVKWPAPYNETASDALEYAASSLLTFTSATTPVGSLTFNLQETGYLTPWATFGTDGNSSPWADATALMQASGQNLYMSYDNVVTSEQWADPDGDPRITLNAGSNGVLLSVARSMSAGFAINGIIATAEGSGLLVPFRNEQYLQDTDVKQFAISAFDVDGVITTYGKNPQEMTTPLVVEEAQLVAVAGLLLNSVVGTQITVEIVPLPHLDVGDRVRVVDTDAGVDLVGIVDAITVPLDASSPESVTVRTKELA